MRGLVPKLYWSCNRFLAQTVPANFTTWDPEPVHGTTYHCQVCETESMGFFTSISGVVSPT